MSLDAVILGDDGKPFRSVRINLDEYSDLMDDVLSSDFSLLSRISDYYQDSTFESEELEELGTELNRILGLRSSRMKATELITALQDLILLAKGMCKPVHFLAD